MDLAKAQLASSGDGQPSGLYVMDKQHNFNVLDSVVYDSATDQLSLVGHFDRRFQGPRIPYLQHLATLLEHPQPQFSLNWTRDSEKRVDALMTQHRTAAQDDSITDKWGKLIGDDSDITRAGRYLLPSLGVSPIANNSPPGSLGIEVDQVPQSAYVRVTSVTPGSAADAAGLKVGNFIFDFAGRPPFTPDEFNRYVRLCGAGNSQPIDFMGGTGRQTVQVTLDRSSDSDVWKGAGPFEVTRALYLSGGDQTAADVITLLGVQDRIGRSDVPIQVTQQLNRATAMALNVFSDVVADMQRGAGTDAAKVELQAFDRIFHFDGTPVTDVFVRAIQSEDPQAAVRDAMAELHRQLAPKLEALLDPIFQRPQGLQIPPELIEEEFHFHPEMVPQYLGVPEDSLLARAMFDGDYLCKRLRNSPELKQKIPGYQTGFEFEVSHPAFRHATGNYRMWISVARMDDAQSPDGKTLAFRDVKMRFNIRDETGDQTAGGKDLPDKPGGYEDLLTSLWDNFEQDYPTLHELRESAKLAAAAKWILHQNPQASLPTEGRVKWRGPDKVPGLVYFEMAPDPVAGDVKTRTTIIAEGGVNLAVSSDPMVVDLSGLGTAPADTLSPALFFHQQTDAARHIFVNTIQVPETPPVAWVNALPAGAPDSEVLSVDLRQLNGATPAQVEQSIGQRKKLEEAGYLAQVQADADQAVTILNAPGPTQVGNFQNLQKQVTADLNAYYRRLFQSAGMDIMDSQSYVSSHPSLEQLGNLGDLGSNATTVEDAAAGVGTGSFSHQAIQNGVAAIKNFSTAVESTGGQLAGSAATGFSAATNAKQIQAALAQESVVAPLQSLAAYPAQNLAAPNDPSGTALSHTLVSFSRQTSQQLSTLGQDIRASTPVPATVSSGQQGVDLSGVPIAHSATVTGPATAPGATTSHNTTAQALDALSKAGASDGGTQPTIDTAGPQGSDLVPGGISTPASSPEMPEIPAGMETDKVIAPAYESLKKWLSQLHQARAEVQKAQAAVAQANDPAAKQLAQQNLSAAQGDSQSLQQSVDYAKKEIVDRTIYLQKFKVSAPVAPAPGPSTGPDSHSPSPPQTPPDSNPPPPAQPKAN